MFTKVLLSDFTCLHISIGCISLTYSDSLIIKLELKVEGNDVTTAAFCPIVNSIPADELAFPEFCLSTLLSLSLVKNEAMLPAGFLSAVSI